MAQVSVPPSSTILGFSELVMRKLLLKALVGILSLWISGCESFPFLNNRDNSTTTTNTPQASPTPTLKAPEPPSPKTANGVFPSSDIPRKPKKAIDLIRSTDPDERIKSLQQGIPTNTTSQPQTPIPNTKDPFSGLPTIPVLSQGPAAGVSGKPMFTQLPEVSSQQVPDLPDLPETKSLSSWRPPERTQPIKQLEDSIQAAQQQNSQQSSQRERVNQANPNLGSQQPSSKSNTTIQDSSQKVSSLPELPIKGIPSAQSREPDFPSKPLDLPSSSTQEVPSLPELPIQPTPPTQWRGPGFPPPSPPAPAPAAPPPDTTIADGIEVSGVVQVGSQKQIIVKVPTELTSRYVKIGQSLANGKVLVKRVNLKKRAVPIVVFEQSGVEISKEVGSKPKTTENQ